MSRARYSVEHTVKLRRIVFILLIFVSVFLFFYYTGISRLYPEMEDTGTYGADLKQLVTLEDGMVAEIEKADPSLPFSFWKNHSGLKLNNTCAHFPNLLSLQFNNLYWQTLVTSNGTFQLLNAYFDNRPNNKAGPTVRLLGMVNRIPDVTTFCQIWYQDLKYPIITKVEHYFYIWRKAWMRYKPGQYEPYLISCNIPKHVSNISIPAAVSLVENECDTASNVLKITYNSNSTKKDFAVCVKPLDFSNTDNSARLVEWIELLRILGAELIHFYTFSTHPNVTKLLNYYKDEGKILVTPFELAGEQPNIPTLRSYYLKKEIYKKRINEVVPYNDCFYQHMYEYEYILLLDIDEVIVPKNAVSWKELLKNIKLETKEEQSSYSAQNLYFFDDAQGSKRILNIPPYMHMLQHVYRSVNYTVREYAKSFFNTADVLTLHNHYPIACFNACRTYDIKLHHAQLQHYRNDCVLELKKECESIKNNLVEDTTIWRYRDILINRVRETLKILKLIKDDQ